MAGDIALPAKQAHRHRQDVSNLRVEGSSWRHWNDLPVDELKQSVRVLWQRDIAVKFLDRPGFLLNRHHLIPVFISTLIASCSPHPAALRLAPPLHSMER